MLRQVENFHLRVIVIAVFYAFGFSACGGSYEDTIAGITVPVPKPMAKSSEAPVEMNFSDSALASLPIVAKWRAIKLTNSINESCPRAVGSRGDHAQRRRHVGLTKNAKTLMVAIGKQTMTPA